MRELLALTFWFLLTVVLCSLIYWVKQTECASVYGLLIFLMWSHWLDHQQFLTFYVEMFVNLLNSGMYFESHVLFLISFQKNQRDSKRRILKYNSSLFNYHLIYFIDVSLLNDVEVGIPYMKDYIYSIKTETYFRNLFY